MFFAEAESLGRAIGQAGLELVFGGYDLGLMGAVAKGCAEAGGPIVGIVPQFFDRPSTSQTQGLSERIVTEDLADRKAVMIDRADAFIVAPGGLGTLDEVLEIMTLNQVGQAAKPVYFLNTLDFYQTFFRFLDELFEQKFLSIHPEGLYKSFESPQDLIKQVLTDLG